MYVVATRPEASASSHEFQDLLEQTLPFLQKALISKGDRENIIRIFRSSNLPTKTKQVTGVNVQQKAGRERVVCFNVKFKNKNQPEERDSRLEILIKKLNSERMEEATDKIIMSLAESQSSKNSSGRCLYYIEHVKKYSAAGEVFLKLS